MWVDDLPEAPAEAAYLIAPGDVLNVRVFQQEAISTPRARVRQDGKVSLPLLNDVQAAGLAPEALAAQIQARLKSFINNPVVNVSVEESRPVSVSVLGEVSRPGVVSLDSGAGVLHALAAAGGFNEFSRREAIFVLRHIAGRATPLRIRFSYEALVRAEGKAPTFALAAGDVVVVE